MLSNRVAVTALTALTPAIWGTTFLVTTELLPPDRPLLAALIRVLPAGLLLLATARRLPSGDWWWRSLVLGTLNIGLFAPLLFVAAYRLPGGVAAIAGALQPLVVAGLAAVLLGQRLSPRTAVAAVAGVAGMSLLVLQANARLDPVGLAAAFAGTLAMASGVVLSKHWTTSAPLLAVTGWQLVAGGLLLLPVTLVFEGLPTEPLTAANLAGYGYLTTVGTALAYSLWFWGIRALPPTNVSFLGLLSPLVATALGWGVLDQRLTAAQGLGGLVVLAAVVIAQLRTGRPDRSSAPDGVRLPRQRAVGVPDRSGRR